MLGFFILCFVFFYITNHLVRRLKKDIKVGKKIKSTSEVQFINIYNHSVELKNDKILKTRFYSDDKELGLLKIEKGDKVSYIVSISYEYIFDLKKLN